MTRQSLVKSVFCLSSRRYLGLWALLSLSACSSTQEVPVGIGTGTDDLKQSPCAACEKEPFFVNGRWVN